MNRYPEDIIAAKGTIRYIGLEGGFYGIIADDGEKYDPGRLPPEFASDGLRVSFRAAELRDALTTRMWGRPVRIIEMTRISR